MTERSRRKSRNYSGAAWIFALLLSGVCAALLWHFEELRVSHFEASKLEEEREQLKERPMSEREIEKAKRSLERKKKNQLKRQVIRLETIKQEMEDIRKSRVTEIENRLEPLLPEEGEPLLEAQLLEAIEALQAKIEQPDINLIEEEQQLEALNQIHQKAEALKPSPAWEEATELSAGIDALLREIRAASGENEWSAPSLEAVAPEMEALQQAAMALSDARALAKGGMVDSATHELEEIRQRPLESMSAAELYDYAGVLREAMGEDFRIARGAQLAHIQDQSLTHALEQVVMPQKEYANFEELAGENFEASVEGMEAMAATLEDALKETQKMGHDAQHQLDQARGMQQKASSAGELALQNQLHDAMLNGSRMHNAGTKGQVVNLVPMMQALSTAQGGQANDETRWGHIGNGIQAGGEATRIIASAKQPQTILLNTKQILENSLPGRMFSRESPRQGWLYLDTWYMIGPFKREVDMARSEFHHTYPPETMIDFDAVYPGKPHPHTGEPMPLSWRFYQSNTPRITPPDEIDGSVYYAYTELYFEDPTEVLLAVASDDAAKVWINDLVVWEDAGRSAWNLDEGFRRVFFHAGFNKLLLRIDNGPGVCQFSVVLCPTNAGDS